MRLPCSASRLAEPTPRLPLLSEAESQIGGVCAHWRPRVLFFDGPRRREAANSASSLHWPHVIDANAILRGETLSPSRPLHEAPVAADVVNELGLPPAAVVGAASRFTEANLYPLAIHKTHRLFLLLGTERLVGRNSQQIRNRLRVSIPRVVGPDNAPQSATTRQ